MRADQPEKSDEFTTADGGRRVLIDALAARFGGSAYATVQLARQLARRRDVETVIVVARRGSIVERGLAHEQGVKCVALAADARLELVPRIAWEALRLPALAARERCDQVISMAGMLPRRPDCRLVCLLFNPVMYESASAANTLRRWAVRRTARRASFVAAPSRRMADLASASIGRQCAVVPLGVDHATFAPADCAGKEILCVADFYAHKRHDLLLDAWLRLSEPRPRLRLVGNPAVDPAAHAALVSRVESLPNPKAVLFEHEISLDRLLRVYHQARTFVMPSEHESFCMPLLESMACGVPPLVRGSPSLRETGGDGATYVDGNDPANWASALRRLLDDDQEHQRARRAALRQAARFSWEAFANALAARF